MNKAIFMVLLLACGLRGADGADYDVILRGGRVLDGTGNPWIQSDVAIRGDRIAATGDLSRARAKRIVNIAGLYIAPGFIDVHSHADQALATEANSAAPTLLAQGVTTIVGNQDGGGPVDLREQRHRLLQHGLGVNVAPMIGHTSARRRVVGHEDRQPTGEELERMRRIVRNGMEEGAFGVSSGLFYTPAFYAKTEEVIELCRVAAEYGGVYTSHIRSEGDANIGLMAAVDELIRISREARVPGIVTHIKAAGARMSGFSSAVIHRIERARAGGLEIWADQYPYTASSTGLSAALLPAWARAGGQGVLLQRMKDPETRARIRAEVAENLDRRGGAESIGISDFRERPEYGGRLLSELAAAAGKPALDFAMEVLEVGNPKIISYSMEDFDVDAFMRQPWTMTCSDGGIFPERSAPHPRGNGAFPRKIRHYVIERGVIDLPFAIRSMTHLPASVLRIADRGMIRPGAFADVVVFDLEKVYDRATFERPHQPAEGMVYVLVNGRFAMDGGKFTGERGGRVLHRQSEAPQTSIQQ